MDLSHAVQELSVQVVGFLLLFIIMRRVAWRPLLNLLDQRRERIAGEFQRIGQMKAELEQVQQDYRRRLAAIEDEARTKIQQAILEGKRVASEIQEQARAQSSAALTKSKEAVEMELAKAKVTLRNDVAQMTVDAVERILRRKLDAKADRELVDQILGELESGRTSANN